MRVPLSWLKDYVDITITAEELAERLTLAGLEVKSLEYIGVPQGEAPAGINVPPSDHLVWARDKIVLGAIREVKSHPNADRLVLAMVDDGGSAPEQVVTGAPNLFAYKNQGPLSTPLWTPYAREGAEVYDGHAEGRQRMILKEKALRGIPNRSMVCSAKELGLGDDHDGILLLDADSIKNAKPGTPLVDVLGDVILEIDLTPNMARAYGILGVAREVAALTGQSMRNPSYEVKMGGAAIDSAVKVEIKNSQLNPRFTAMLIRDIVIQPSPQWLRRRLEAVGVRAINNIVDVTNYIMFEVGQPLHAFDYDILLRRSGGKTPTIITRNATPGEKLTTLDEVDRVLDDQTILVCDTAGVLSLGGIMGGAESEIQPDTKNVLLEAANWDFINIRRTMFNQKMSSEAGLRFSRGVHPALAELGCKRAAELMRVLGGEKANVLQGMLDVYPRVAPAIEIDLPLSEVERIVGIPFTAEAVSNILTRLQFGVEVRGAVLHVKVPDHRVDISAGEIGIADLCEEIARIYGYDRIPNTLVEDVLPPQYSNDALIREERVRDLLAEVELREVINYRLTTPQAEGRLIAPGQNVAEAPYVTLANPISMDKTVLRHTLLNGVLEDMVANLRHTNRQKLFEIGSVFLPVAGMPLPDEPRHLAIAITGPRTVSSWQDSPADRKDADSVDFFDLKGIFENLCVGLRLPASAIAFKPEQHPTYYPGRSAGLYVHGKRIGMIGEIHPLVREAYKIAQPVAALEIELDPLIADLPLVDKITPVPTQPAIFEDIALVVSDYTPASEVEATIRQAGGALLRNVELFDVYRGDPIPAGKKSLAYKLTYRADDRTLTDSEAAKVRQQIIKTVEKTLDAKLRG